MNIDGSKYFDQLILDYAGNESELGAIQKAALHNKEKAKYLRKAVVLLSLIIIALMVMFAIALNA